MKKMNAAAKINSLHGLAKFILFLLSYLPLFLLIIFKQVSDNYDYLNWAGLTREGIWLFLNKFLLSAILLFFSVIGIFGYLLTFKNVRSKAHNGNLVRVKDISNKNSEAIGYIATYIIPFLFQNFNSLVDCISILLLLIIIYPIYINSNLLLINPVLSMKYSIYEIVFNENDQVKKGLIISKDRFLEEESIIKIYEIGYKLFYSIDREESDEF